MLKLSDPGLSDKAMTGLQKYQARVNDAGSYRNQVAAGKTLFSRYNRPGNHIFTEVRQKLAVMCAGVQRCGYCEDSVGDEVEHIKPKDLYPGHVFAWENYLFACGQCNRKKNNKFAVIQSNQLLDITRRKGAEVKRPQGGSPALIDPRREDPLNFLYLEMEDTFYFLPGGGLSQMDELRAQYSICVLKLNREVLLKARREAYESYHARLFEYRGLRDNGAGNESLGRRRDAIVSSAHPTVWREMQRQHAKLSRLRALFQDVPEALGW